MNAEVATAVRDMGMHSLENEYAMTRKVIAAIPEGGDWRPDPKARNAFELAWHIVASEIQMLDETAEMKFSMEEKHAQPGSVAGMLAFYDEHFPRVIAKLRAMTAQQLVTPVDFYGAFNFPAFVYIGFAEKHSVHHRGQLSTYLRPLGSKVPGIYGGSADEPWQPPQ